VLYDALLRLGYDAEVPIYCCRLSMANGLDIYETSVMIPLNQEDPWTGTIIGSDPNTTVEQTAHIALTFPYHRDANCIFSDSEYGKSHVEAAP
jgi:hypothetical protein